MQGSTTSAFMRGGAGLSTVSRRTWRSRNTTRSLPGPPCATTATLLPRPSGAWLLLRDTRTTLIYLVQWWYHLFFCFVFSTSLFTFQPEFYPRRSSGQAVVAGVVPSPPPVRAFTFFVTHRVQHSHCSSIFIDCVANSRSRAFR